MFELLIGGILVVSVIVGYLGIRDIRDDIEGLALERRTNDRAMEQLRDNLLDVNDKLCRLVEQSEGIESRLQEVLVIEAPDPNEIMSVFADERGTRGGIVLPRGKL